MTNKPITLDLDQFTSAEQAMVVIEREEGFDEAVKPLLIGADAIQGPTMLFTFCQSALTRANGLYEAVVRGIRASNHPAVFVLMRQLAETVAVVRYVADKPSYVTALLRPERDRKPGAPKRKTPQALIDYIDKHYNGQFKVVYAELSELTHFGSLAVWQSHVYLGGRQVRWSSRPAWRDQHTLYIACAQALELATEMESALVALVTAVRAEAANEGEDIGRFLDVGPDDIDAVLGRARQKP